MISLFITMTLVQTGPYHNYEVSLNSKYNMNLYSTLMKYDCISI